MIFKGQADAIKSSPAFRWTVGVGAGAVLALSLVLLFLLTQATGNRELYERNYARLLVLNIAVAALLLLVIGWTPNPSARSATCTNVGETKSTSPMKNAAMDDITTVAAAPKRSTEPLSRVVRATRLATTNR